MNLHLLLNGVTKPENIQNIIRHYERLFRKQKTISPSEFTSFVTQNLERVEYIEVLTLRRKNGLLRSEQAFERINPSKKLMRRNPLNVSESFRVIFSKLSS